VETGKNNFKSYQMIVLLELVKRRQVSIKVNYRIDFAKIVKIFSKKLKI